MTTLLFTGKHSDMRIICSDGVVIECHRLLLAFFCEFFEVTLTTSIPAKKDVVMHYSSLVMHFVLRCIYSSYNSAIKLGCRDIDAIIDCVDYLQVFDRYREDIYFDIATCIKIKTHSKIPRLLAIIYSDPALQSYETLILIDYISIDSILAVIAEYPQLTELILKNCSNRFELFIAADDPTKCIMRGTYGFMRNVFGNLCDVYGSKLDLFLNSELKVAIDQICNNEKPQISEHLWAIPGSKTTCLVSALKDTFW